MELCDNCGNAFEKEQEFREHIRKEHSVACEDLDCVITRSIKKV